MQLPKNMVRKKENWGIRSHGIAIAAHVKDKSVQDAEIREIITDLMLLRQQTSREVTLEMLIQDSPRDIFGLGLKSPANLILAGWGYVVELFRLRDFLADFHEEPEDNEDHHRMVVMSFYTLLLHNEEFGVELGAEVIEAVRQINYRILTLGDTTPIYVPEVESPQSETVLTGNTSLSA